jgi:tRNA (guanine37-N1)-methyltransferase
VAPQEVDTARIDLALIHYPVINKKDEIIGSAVTNLDLHDISRAARTFGINTLYIVTPYRDQQELFKELLDHWLTGHGAEYNAKRGEALSLVRFCDNMDELRAKVTAKWQQRPIILSTCAQRRHNRIWTYREVRQKMIAGGCFLILFGTAWGLAQEVLDAGDGILPPITGSGSYNHLSVRSAAAIILDRLLGERYK